MTANRKRFRVEDVQKIVDEELVRTLPFSNRWHGISEDGVIENVVAPPRSERFYKHQFAGPGFVWRWRVWDEGPHDRSAGYLVVYEPPEGVWDLATKPKGRRYGRLLGFKASSFEDALVAM